MTLPTAPITNDLDPERLRAILFGDPGSGKTSLAAGWYPATNLIIDLDGGTRFLPGAHFIERPATYTDFTKLVLELCAGGHAFKTVTIDTGDKLVRMASAEAAQRGGKIAAEAVEYGKGTAERDATIFRDLGKLLATDLGVILCAHPISVNKGTEENPDLRVLPRLEKGEPGDRLRLPIIGEFDFLLAVVKRSEAERVLITGGDPRFETKRRVPLPDVLPADAKKLHAALVAGVGQLAPVAA